MFKSSLKLDSTPDWEHTVCHRVNHVNSSAFLHDWITERKLQDYLFK